ncbi:MAG: DegT/DnrJ/EryC1/StrS family aminotransferase [Candidatus Nanoarchaeia archaeon]|nr:DegT/DnrJ/EryC1/StrS family aminotransferase [Candidatus Nanoarchaeia archaeon]
MTNPSKYLGNELKYLEQVLNGESWSATGGSWAHNLEQEMAKKVGARYAVAFNSGTSTLHAALEAVGVMPGDEVISPALTVIMDTTATLHANAIPVYCDIDPNTFTIDPRDIEQKVTDRTKAIIVVALYGNPPDMEWIFDIASQKNIPVIMDAAQAVGAKYKGYDIGRCGTIASYSFEASKILSCGEGGMITTEYDYLAEKCRKIGGHGFKNLTASEGRVRLNQDLFQDPNYKRHDMIGWNYRMPEFTAAVALAQLERVDELIRLRVESAKIFMEVMSQCDYLIPQKVLDDCVNTYYTLGVRYLSEKTGVSWQEFRKSYIEEGGDGIYGAWAVPYLEPCMTERQFVKRFPAMYEGIRYDTGMCPIAEAVQPTIMQFKTNYRDLELAKVKADALDKTIRKYK